MQARSVFGRMGGLRQLHDEVSGGDSSLTVAVLDGPIDHSHEAFSGARLSILSADPAGAAAGHGTHVASIIAGQPGGPVDGIAPGCTVICVPVYHEDEAGNLISCAQSTLARAIRHAVENGANIINISGGQFTRTGRGDRFLEDTVRECAKRNVLIVAAAGNDGCRCLHVPAAMPSTLAVGASDDNGNALPFSNFGDAYSTNGLLALGQDVPGAAAGGGIELKTGTSFAAPIATGVVALLLSLQLKLGQKPDPQAIRKILIDTVDPCDPATTADCARTLAGRMNIERAAEAVRQAVAPSSATRPGLTASAGAQGASHRRSANPTPGVLQKGEVISMTHHQSVSPSVLGPDGQPMASAQAASGVVTQSEAVVPAAAEQAGVAPQASPSQTASAATVPQVQSPQPAVAASDAHAGEVVPSAAVQVPAMVASGVSVPVSPSYAGVQPSCGPAVQGRMDGSVKAQSCGCSGGIQPSEHVSSDPIFAIGKLFYDFDSEARFDYFVQAMAGWWPKSGHTGPFPGSAAPWNPLLMIEYLLWSPKDGGLPHFPDSNALIWTLNIDGVPIYALNPEGAFGYPMYSELTGNLWYQEQPANTKPGHRTKEAKYEPAVERVSQAGWIDGEVRLLNGTVVPNLRPVWRGMFGWRTEDIIGTNPPEGLKPFLERVYNEFRNAGISPQDRALNYSAFNAYNAKQVFVNMFGKKMFLDTVNVDRSTICRPDSDCWDVTWTFFDPTQTLTKARTVFQYTIDVSDLVPVTVGKLREWEIF